MLRPPPLKTYLFSCFTVKTSRIKASTRRIKALCKKMETYSPFVKPPDPRMLKLKFKAFNRQTPRIMLMVRYRALIMKNTTQTLNPNLFQNAASACSRDTLADPNHINIPIIRNWFTSRF